MSTTSSLIECYEGYSVNDQARYNSSSGGFFFELAQYVLAHDGIVVGAAMDGSVAHLTIVEKMEDLPRLMGSKYTQAYGGDIYKAAKSEADHGRLVLFSGTPCQCSALKKYLKKGYDNVYIVDFVCHGVPSPLLFKKYLSWQGKDRAVQKVCFRDKRNGWGNYGLSLRFDDGEEYFEHHKKNPYMKMYLSNLFLRPSCYSCRSKGEDRSSDMTLGDMWGTKLTENVRGGVSLIILHTTNGYRLFEQVKDNLFISSVQYDSILDNNPSYFKSSGKPFKRNVAMDTLSMNPNELFEKPEYFTKVSMMEKAIRKGMRIYRERIKKDPGASCYLQSLIDSDLKVQVEKNACCGCGMCVSVCAKGAITIQEDSEGFYYPVVDQSKCIGCKLCIKTCLNR